MQQDNTKPHIDSSNQKFVNAVGETGFNINLVCQAPNSPDEKVLNLGYSRAIQSLQYQESPTTIDELIQAVEKTFNELSRDVLNNVFLSHQQCMIEERKVGGGNNCKVPHISKNRLQFQGQLPVHLPLNLSLVQDVQKVLQNPQVAHIIY